MKFLLFTITFLFGTPLTNVDTTIADFSGSWEYSVSTPDGTFEGEMVLTKEGDAYKGHLDSMGAQIPMENVVVAGNKMTFNLNVQGFPVSVNGNFEGDIFTAICSVEGMEMPLKAKKKA